MATTQIIKQRPVIETPELAAASGLHPLLRRIYAARGVNSSNALTYGLKCLHPFTTLSGIKRATTCLHEALKAKQRILIVGDFDADGATSAALAVSALKAMGADPAQVDYLAPNRFDYGYGLTPEIVAVIAKREPAPDLLITVDNGISSLAGVAAANALGMKVIVTDHHLPGAKLPEAAAIVNPNLEGDTFPSKHLAGVGVIFYLMLALRAALREADWFTAQKIAEPNMAQFLDLVALGTVADVVHLDHNNRILVAQGIKRMREHPLRPGIGALLEIANRTPDRLVASDLSFAIAPRLNAAGRLDDISLGIACLLSDDIVEARKMAAQLDLLNRERRDIEATMQQQACRALDKLQDLRLETKKSLPYGLCLFDAGWHQGVVGILAGRLKERLHRPVAVFTQIDDNALKASVRSVRGLHIRDVLDAIATRYPGLLIKFGGHALAAGLSLEKKNYAHFTTAFDEEVRRQLNGKPLQDEIETDGVLTPAELSLDTARLLRAGGPWGQGFPEPLFDGEFTIVDQRIVGQKHLRLVVKPREGGGQPIEGIVFNMDTKAWPNYRCTAVRLVYALDINYFRDIERPQLLIKHIMPLN